MDDDPRGLTAGYEFTRLRAQTVYTGVLRRSPKAAPSWRCHCKDHLSPGSARKCAEAERERRLQGQGQVFTLLHCGPCSKWWDDDSPGEAMSCPRCSVPLERLKLAVTWRGPAVDAGNP